MIFTFFQILIVGPRSTRKAISCSVVFFLKFALVQMLFFENVFSKHFEMYLNTLVKYLYFVGYLLVLPKSILYLNTFGEYFAHVW